MRHSHIFLFIAVVVALACGQTPSVLPEGAPTVADRAGTPEGGGLARVTVTAEGEEPPAATETVQGTEEPADDGRATAESEATGTPETEAETPGPQAAATDDAPVSGPEGALVRVTMAVEVGVLLDEFPEEMRKRVADALLAQPEDDWLARAERQVHLTRLRMNFRDSNWPGKGQLPLPQSELWSIALDSAGPQRRTVQGHELVMLNYTLTTTLLSDAASVADSEPALDEVGGVWEEYFVLPADPDLLLQRTGRACLNDAGFPPNSVDSENAWYFYDFDRTNCFEALASRVGALEARLRFERVSWDGALADRVRTGEVTNDDAPDLRVLEDYLAINRVIYRYVAPGDCALVEGAVDESGWRRLLQFDASVHNVGGATLDVGIAQAGAGEDSVFVFAPCHDHVHHRHYGEFTLENGNQLVSSKQAFCVQSTDRISNNELSPLTHDYSCRIQGIQAGWADEYIAGLDTQWIDITDLDIPDGGREVELGFISNEEGFLCEGTPVLGEEGEPVWEPSGLTTEDGETINRPQCDFVADWDGNNVAVREVFVQPVGSFVTLPCANGEVGPLRNCGFTELTLEDVDPICRVQQEVSLSLQVEEDGAPQVVRVCERSALLGTGVACTFEDSLTNVIVGEEATAVNFSCPAVRDVEEGEEAEGGNFALYVAPVWAEDEGAVRIAE